MDNMTRNDYIMCLEDTLPYVTREQFYTAMKPAAQKSVDTILSQPIKQLHDDVLKDVWSKIKPIL